MHPGAVVYNVFCLWLSGITHFSWLTGVCLLSIMIIQCCMCFSAGTASFAFATIASFIVATNCLDFGSENAIHIRKEFKGVISVAILTANEFVITFSAVSVVDNQCTGHIIDNILDIYSAGTSAPVYLQCS